MTQQTIDLAVQLKQLAAYARQHGKLSYDQVGGFLPDEAANGRRVDMILDLLDGLQVDVVEDPNSPLNYNAEKPEGEPETNELEPALLPTDLPKLTDDPIRMYLSQMCKIPLLAREQEVHLAKKIEISRKRLRHRNPYTFFSPEPIGQRIERASCLELL